MNARRPLVISILASVVLVLVTFATTHAAAVSYTGGAITEDFDYPKLAKEPDAFMEPFPTAGLPGWDSDEGNYTVMDGTTTTGALYSFGMESENDRALGSIASGGTGVVFYGLELQNDTLNSYTGFKMLYTGEQWRQTTAVQNVLNFQYSLTATSVSSSLGYTGVSSLDFGAIHFGSATGGLDGNADGNHTTLSDTVSFGGDTWDPGETLFIRWRDMNDAGSDQGLGVDDIRFEAIPEPTAILLALVAVAGMASMVRHRPR